jgi:alcohol dehydrogenase class IV
MRSGDAPTSFEFAASTRIIFGRGKSSELGKLATMHGARALVVTGRNTERVKSLLNNVESAGVHSAIFPVGGEPEIELVTKGLALAREHKAGVVVAVGGGSVIDTAKAIAAMLTNPGKLLDYLEVVGRGQALKNKSAPFIAVPTTAGTGSEVTRNAVLGSPAHKVKASLRSALMLPDIALVDPDLTLPLPPELTASTGLDALTQLIEPFVSGRANVFTDALCRDGIARCARALPRACSNGEDVEAREEMSLCSVFGGLALANAGLGAVHGFAGPIGGMFPAPHGAVCAALLPHVFKANTEAVRARGNQKLAGRFDDVAALLIGDSKAKADDATRWLQQLITELRVKPLSAYGLSSADVPDVVAKAKQASSMKANPVELSDSEVSSVLEAAIG